MNFKLDHHKNGCIRRLLWCQGKADILGQQSESGPWKNFQTLCIDPLAPEFKIFTKLINAGDKMVAPRRQPMPVRITLSSVSYSKNGYGKDFLMYGHDPGGLLVVHALHLCVSTRKENEDNPFG